MTVLDRYVGRIAAGAFGTALAFFLFLAVLVDVLTRVSKYVDNAAKQGLGGFEMVLYMGAYYAKLLPVLVTTVTPFATVIACMFTIARLQHANEVVPMLFVGRSVQRIARPLLFGSVLAGLGMAACWQWVVPSVRGALTSAETVLSPSGNEQKFVVVERFGTVDEYFRAGKLFVDEGRIEGLVLLVQGQLAADARLVTAPVARWDAERRDWRLEKGVAEHTRGKEPQAWLGRSDLTPALLSQVSRDSLGPELLSYTDLLQMVAARPNSPEIRLALHRHVTWPLANVLLLLLVLPIAIHYERGSRVGRVLLAIGLCGAYTLVDLTCQSLGDKNLLHPVVAAWTPPIVFGSLGLVLFAGART
jgi:lipopolysaccharide export system permease protein